MTVIPEGYGQINMLFTGEGVPSGAQCVLGFENIATVEWATVGGEFNDQVDASDLMTSFTDFVTYAGCLVKLGPNETGPSGVVVASIEGSVESQAVSPNTSVLVRKGTPDGGRAGRGRMYLPGVAEGSVTAGGELDTLIRAAIAAKLELIREGMSLADLPLKVLHGADSPITAPSSITSFDVDTKVATQRRRLRR